MAPRHRRTLLRGLLLGLIPAVVAAAPGLRETFDGPTNAWRQPSNPGATRIVEHRRVRVERGGEEAGAEHIRFTCPAGYSGVFLYPVGKAPVLEDLRVAASLRSSTYGVQLAARVVFPRTLTESSRPRTMIVRGGDRYEAVGEWAQLSISKLPTLVKRQARLLRAGAGAGSIDEREAFVDSIALIVPGGPGGAEVWVEQLELDGVLLEDAAAEDEDAGATASAAPSAAPTDIRVTARGFSDDNRLIMPRIWQSGGESFEMLKRRGFNAAALNNAPTDEHCSQAQKHALRLICPPPSEGDAASIEPVLAWLLQGSTDGRSIDSVQPTIGRVRDDRWLAARPLIATPVHAFAAWSRLADGLVLEADGASGATTGAYSAACAEALPGTPVIARVSLSPGTQSTDQLRAFAPSGRAPVWRDFDEVSSGVWRAVASGAKGLWLHSQPPLGGAAPADRQIADAVELLNLKLALIEPWLVGGERVGDVVGADRQPVATIFRRGRTKLVVGFGDRVAPSTSSPAEVGFVVPAVSETASAFSLTPAGLSTINRTRTVGGVSVAAPSLVAGEFVLLTDDRRAVSDIRRRIAVTARKAVELQQKLSTAELQQFESIIAGSPASQVITAVAAAAPAAKRAISRSKAAASGPTRQPPTRRAATLAGCCVTPARGSANT